MELILTNTGSYPRIGDNPEQQRLRKVIASFDHGEAALADIEQAEKDVTLEALNEQLIAGIDLVTDGQIRWYDPISHIAGKLDGVRIGGLLRFFDTNFYFRQPIVEGEIKWKEPVLKDDFLFAKANSSKPVKPVITGPYTLAVHSAGEFDLEKLAFGYAEAITKEVEILSSAGAKVIQIDEPSVLRKDANFKIFSKALNEIVKAKGNSKIALYTYFGDVSGIYERLQELPFDIIGIDFTYNPDLPEIVASLGSQKALGLGLIDGRNTRLEEAAKVIKILEKIVPKIDADYSYLNPSSGLEYLPRNRAFEKLELMVKIKKAFEGKK